MFKICGGLYPSDLAFRPCLTDGVKLYPFPEGWPMAEVRDQANTGTEFSPCPMVHVDRAYVEVRARGVYVQYVPPGGRRKLRKGPLWVRVGAGRTPKTRAEAKRIARRRVFDLVSLNILEDQFNASPEPALVG